MTPSTCAGLVLTGNVANEEYVRWIGSRCVQYNMKQVRWIGCQSTRALTDNNSDIRFKWTYSAAEC